MMRKNIHTNLKYLRVHCVMNYPHKKKKQRKEENSEIFLHLKNILFILLCVYMLQCRQNVQPLLLIETNEQNFFFKSMRAQKKKE